MTAAQKQHTIAFGHLRPQSDVKIHLSYCKMKWSI